MIGWRKARNVALVSLVAAGVGGVATAALAGAAPASSPWAHVRICNTAPVKQTFHIQGTSQTGGSAQSRDYSLAPKGCATVSGRWQIGKLVVITHRNSTHPKGVTDNDEIWSDTPKHSTVTMNIGVDGYLDGTDHTDTGWATY